MGFEASESLHEVEQVCQALLASTSWADEVPWLSAHIFLMFSVSISRANANNQGVVKSHISRIDPDRCGVWYQGFPCCSRRNVTMLLGQLRALSIL